MKNRFAKRIISILLFVGLILPMLFMAEIQTDAKGKSTIIVVIDAGHGGDGVDDEKDSGAKYDAINKLEKEINLITAQALYDELSEYNNVKVYMTRDDDNKMTIKERLDFARKKKADVFISCHYNASEYKRFYGSEIYTSAYGKYYAYGQSLGGYIEKAWTNDGMYSKGIKTRLGEDGDYYGIIRIGREYKIPAIILEHGYLDNEADVEKLGTEEAWKHVGVVDATAIAEFYGLSKEEKQKTVEANIKIEEPKEAVLPDTSAPIAPKLTIDYYDMTTGELRYTIEASEPDSKLYLYGVDTKEALEDENSCFMNLSIWEEGKTSQSGTIMLEPEYAESISCRVYNTYEKYVDTPLVKVTSATEVIYPEPLEAIAEPEDYEVVVEKPEPERDIKYKLSVIGAVLAVGALIGAIFVLKDKKNFSL